MSTTIKTILNEDTNNNYFLCSKKVVDFAKPENISKPFKSGWKNDKRKIIDELEILDNEIRNMNKQDDYSLNMFGKYFQDYSKQNNYDGYKAISTYLDGKTKGIEYCIININKLKLTIYT